MRCLFARLQTVRAEKLVGDEEKVELMTKDGDLRRNENVELEELIACETVEGTCKFILLSYVLPTTIDPNCTHKNLKL
jgi:hypothetical protein